MKVFISWSGEYSREVAEKLSVWVPSVIQSVDTFFSPDDIGKGENWNNVLSNELNDCNFGIICLTPENVAAPWIHFEAGALAKTLDSRLSSVMFGINPSDVKGPLSRFQNTKFERNDFLKLLQAINAASDNSLKPENLFYLFDALWERLNNEIRPIMKKYESIHMAPKVPSQTNDSEAIQEILSIVRKVSNNMRSDKSAEIENIESPHTIPNKAILGHVVQLCLILLKETSTLSDETKQILREFLPQNIVDKAISSLEDIGLFRYNMYTRKSYAQTVIDGLLKSPDLLVKSDIRPA